MSRSFSCKAPLDKLSQNVRFLRPKTQNLCFSRTHARDICCSCSTSLQPKIKREPRPRRARCRGTSPRGFGKLTLSPCHWSCHSPIFSLGTWMNLTDVQRNCALHMILLCDCLERTLNYWWSDVSLSYTICRVRVRKQIINLNKYQDLNPSHEPRFSRSNVELFLDVVACPSLWHREWDRRFQREVLTKCRPNVELFP